MVGAGPKTAVAAAPELVLRHDGVRWLASGDDLTADGGSLAELEDALRASIATRYGLSAPREVVLRFDCSGMPAWLRQYQPHYFNYTLRIGRAE